MFAMVRLQAFLDPLMADVMYHKCTQRLRWSKREGDFGRVIEAQRIVGVSRWTLDFGWWVIRTLPDEVPFLNAWHPRLCWRREALDAALLSTLH
jgi:hypothetical protein